MIRTNSGLSAWQHILLAVSSVSFAAMLATAPLEASPASDIAIQVSFKDLDLDHTAGVARLYQRLRAAAKQACGSQVTTGSRLPAGGWQTCVDVAVDRAVKQVDRPALTDYHLARAGGATPRQTAGVIPQR